MCTVVGDHIIICVCYDRWLHNHNCIFALLQTNQLDRPVRDQFDSIERTNNKLRCCTEYAGYNVIEFE